MNDSNEPQLDQRLRDVEAQLRRLKPRDAQLGWNDVAPATRVAARNPVWSYAITWMSGVAVGCLIMVLLPESTPKSQQTSVVPPVSSRPTTPETHVAQHDTPELFDSHTEDRFSLSQSLVQRIESIVQTKPLRHRLLLGSHLNDTQAITPPPLVTSANMPDDWQPAPLPSRAKTRQQLMSELLGGQRI